MPAPEMVKVHRCAQCLIATYCSTDCQQKESAAHNKACHRIANVTASSIESYIEEHFDSTAEQIEAIDGDGRFYHRLVVTSGVFQRLEVVPGLPGEKPAPLRPHFEELSKQMQREMRMAVSVEPASGEDPSQYAIFCYCPGDKVHIEQLEIAQRARAAETERKESKEKTAESKA